MVIILESNKFKVNTKDLIQRKLDTSKDDTSNAFLKFNADPESSAEFTGRG